jgi:urease subunit beta/urease subunit gamma/beta
MKPGEYLLNEEGIVLNEGREVVELTVKNFDRRPIQVGSHFHFFEANRALVFDRKKAFGKRLDIPSGTAVRFEPGEEKKVQLVSLGGRKNVYGLNGLTEGSTNGQKSAKKALSRARNEGFGEV